MKRLLRHALPALLALLLAACTGPQPRCGFADIRLTASMFIGNLVAEYYVAHQQWPRTREQLEAQLRSRTPDPLSAEEIEESAALLKLFHRIDLRPRGDHLLLHFRFQNEDENTTQTLLLKPRPTVDEILESATRTPPKR